MEPAHHRRVERGNWRLTRPLCNEAIADSDNASVIRGRCHPPAWQTVIFANIPVVWIGWAILFATLDRHWSFNDFLTFRRAAADLIHAHSPYPPPTPRVLAHGLSFVYPPIAAYPFIPFAALPAHVAIVVYLVASLAAIGVALWLVGVRDWRILGVVALWEPLFMWLIEGPIEPWLLLLLAIGWRWRGRTLRLAAVVALLVSAKLFLWPLLLWLLATRRRRCLIAASAMTGIFVVLPFANAGLQALRSYPHVLRTLAAVFGPSSFSLLAVFDSFTSRLGAQLALLAAAIALFALVCVVGNREDGDRRAFCAAVVGAVLLSPIVWAHYFLLLAIPIALVRPKLSLLWGAPLFLWATGSAALGEPHRLAIGLLVPLMVLAASCRVHPTRRVEAASVPGAAAD